MALEELLSHKANIKVGHFKTLFKSDALDQKQRQNVEMSIQNVEYDIKNKYITFELVQFDSPDFYRMLTNILADTNLNMAIKNHEIAVDNENNTYLKTKYPHLVFNIGRVMEHNHKFVNKQNDTCIHKITILFKKFELIYNDISNF